jgi:outer membrane protein insertion porin family
MVIAAIAVVAIVAIVVLALHTNSAQSRVLGWSIRELERRFSLDLTADDLHYNLAARRVTMTNVRLAASGHHEEPFFTANAVTVRLPWAAYAGRLRFDEVAIDRGVVTISRDAHGVSNLPPARGARDPDAPSRRIDIRALAIRQLDFAYLDAQRDIEIRTPKIRSDLTWGDGARAKGPLAIEESLLIRIRDRRVDIKPVTGIMSFDGSSVGLERLSLRTSEGDFLLSGEIVRALDQPMLNLTFTGTTELAQSSRWAAPPIPVGGVAEIDAHMTGAPGAFVLDAHVNAGNATVGAHQGVVINAAARLTPSQVTVSRASIRPNTGGEILATVDVPFGAEADWWVKANYTGVDAATAFRLADVAPLPFGAALSGDAVLDREAGKPFRLVVRNRATARASSGTAPLDGQVVFTIAGDRWQAEQDHRLGGTHVRGNIGGIWNRTSATQSTFEGKILLDARDVGETARYAALFGFASPEIVRNASGPMTAAATMSGTFTEPRFVGEVRSDGVEIPSLGNTAIAALFDASRRGFNATSITATAGTTTVTGDVLADLVSRRLQGELQVASPNAAELMTAVPEALRLQGPLTAVTTLAGTVDEPSVVTQVSGSNLTLSGQSVDALEVNARVVGDGINVERLTLRQPGGAALQATGRYDWGARSYSVEVNGQDLVWRGTLARLGDAEARFAVKFGGAGPIDKPVGEGVIEYAITGGVAGELIDRGVANVRLNGETAIVTAHIPSLGAFLTANVQPRAPYTFEAVLVMNRIDLAPVSTLAGVPPGDVTGNASLSATAGGTLTDVAGSKAFINLQEVAADVSGVRVQLVTPSRLAWDGGTLSIDTLDMSVGQGRLLASGQLATGGIETARWESSFKGELGDLLRIGRPFGVPAPLDGRGPVDIVWRSGGGITQSTASLRLARGSVTWAELPPVEDLVVEAAFNGAALNITQLTGRWQQGNIEGAASIPRAVLEARETGGAILPAAEAGFAKLRVSGLTEASLAPLLSTATLAGITGRLSATLDARITRASLEGIAGTVVMDEAAFTLAGVDVQQAHPSILEIDGGVLRARDVTFNAGGGPLTLTGTATLVPTDAQTVDFSIKGTADLRILSAFAPTVATDGDAKVSVGVGGTLTAPVFNGRVDVAGAEVAIREPRVVVSDLSGTIALDGQRVVFDAFNGTANGGRLQLDGGFLLEGFTPASGGLVMVIERAALEYPEGLQSEANAIVTLRPGAPAWSLTGEISVERSAYTDPISVAALIAARGTRAPVAGGEDSWLDQLRLNLWVTTVQDLLVDNNYGRFEVGGALRVSGTATQPVLAGRLTLAEGGEMYLAGHTFHIERGSISFTNPFRIVPEFDIGLRTLVSGTDINLRIDGPLDRLRTDVTTNNPAVDSREAITMLFGGQGEDAVALLSAELLGATGRAIGLDTLRVERGFDSDEFRADPGLVADITDPSARLTLSKRLRPDVELTLSQSLRESGGLTAVVSYRPRRNIELRAVSRDNRDRWYALRHEITFGGRTTAMDDLGKGAEVAKVTISGNPGRPVEELIASLDLDPGDSFNFHEWQRDIDRLGKAYHDLGHYEVRVRGTRQASEDGLTVALDYAIEPGPVTELVIEGLPLDAGLQEEIHEVWRRSIFDRFLLDEIEALIARHLLEENEIGSTVEATVAESTPARKLVRVMVTAGTIVRSREIHYTGNRAVRADDLNDVVTEAALDVDGWLDPRRIAEALEDFYRSEGYLAVTVKADQPRVEGDVGVLPVVITEGARFVIGVLTFPGVSPQRLASAAVAVRLDAGAPFTTQGIDAARERLERMYAGDGFNSAQIEVNTVPDPASGTVDVSVAVLEGLQQVLREVTLQGDTRTDEDVVRRALRLRIGQAVNLGAWAQARKRLYDTNVFRQVDIEPVAIDATSVDLNAGIQPVRAVVRVVEYPLWRLRYGAQFTDELSEVPGPDGDNRLQSLGVVADLQNQNLFGRAITAGIAGRYERNRQAASLFLSNSSFFSLPIRSSGFVYTSRQRFAPGNPFETIDSRVGVSGEQRWRPFRTGEVLWSYRYERTAPSLPNQAPEDSPLPFTDARLNAGLYFDRRDDPSDPSRGWFTAANWDQGVPALGSDYGAGRLLVQHAMYRSVNRLVVAGRFQIGSGYGADALLPSQRFLLGGATTVRGYAEDSLGPGSPFGIPGGDALLNLNGELRFPVRGWVQGVAFIDAGDVFVRPVRWSFGELAVGYGLGLRLATPFAMLRADFGIPARTLDNERGHRLSSGRWYFGIGHIF